ncbi:dTDP-4-amino-4,6-dideoxygalactose transaminase [Lutibacter sp. Hel_I_33_5]|uniref:DegT/DnrJ/EryC1/StrS family aminotransferase n=1 Tax=Lutibacter sp. Hel_I_33_5 TaxID=1566289 RepID=UPI0011A31EAE|nr:DegT/DnrJ/EryC1/StrS family aminotransferase [Lutibacter sp. Hel_I_33_5]TVZ55509.1 dTDP-4-amino-4,6-dideoxygalactose transaminase [Lutibacter sp. Hel_I_33_5]
MNFKVPFSGRGHKYTDEEVKLVANVMQTAIPLTQGKYRDEFEEKFAKYLGVDYAFTTNNATSALELSAQMCQLSKGDEVICPSHTFTSSMYPFIKNGGHPIWADIDSETKVVSLESIKKCVTAKTKVIIAVHLYGYCINDIEAIASFAKEKNILLVEDVAQAMGTEINKKKAGTFGDFGIFSLHSHKNITTLGEGGFLIVKDLKYANIIPMLRHNGHTTFDYVRDKYWIPAMGNLDLPELNGLYLMPNNYCLGEVECALGSKLLERLDDLNQQKRDRAIKFIDSLSHFELIKFHRVESMQHNHHLLVGIVADGKRDLFINKMAYEYGIQCVVQYYPLNRYDLYEKLGYGNANCPNADAFYDNMVSFPFHIWMPDDEFNYMLEKTKAVLSDLKL